MGWEGSWGGEWAGVWGGCVSDGAPAPSELPRTFTVTVGVPADDDFTVEVTQ